MEDNKPECHPRGEMCMSCRNLMDNCSHLSFSSMYVLEEYTQDGNNFKEVRCKEFKRNG